MSFLFQVDQIVNEYQLLKKQSQQLKHLQQQQQQLQKEGGILSNTINHTPSAIPTTTTPPTPFFDQTPGNNLNNLKSPEGTIDFNAHSQFFLQQITPLIQTNQTSQLYSLSHKLINLFPEDEHAYFCIGSYYWCINKLDLAQRFLRRALKFNRNFSEAWILLGHIFSANEETEQALSAYRTAIRLLPQHKLPLVCLSKELLHSGNYWLAAHMLQSAIALDPTDLLIMNEMATIAVKLGNLPHGEQILKKAIQMMQGQQKDSSSTCEILYNYATILRKLGQYDQAILWYKRCLKVAWHKVWALVAIGFTLHLVQRFEEAATYYHQALAIQPNCVICSEMLNHLMEDMILYQPIELNPSNEQEKY